MSFNSSYKTFDNSVIIKFNFNIFEFTYNTYILTFILFTSELKITLCCHKGIYFMSMQIKFQVLL